MNDMDIMPGDEPLMAFFSDARSVSPNYCLSPSGMVLHLNVGGIRYITTYSTLLSKGNSNFFNSLLSQRMGSTKDETGAWFIDRDGDVFKYILEFFRTGEVDIEDLEQNGITRKRLMREAQFYCLEGLVEMLAHHEQEERERKLAAEQAAQIKYDVLRKDGYYILSTGGIPNMGGLCEALVFFDDGKCIFSNGTNAANNLIVFSSVSSLPDIWKEVEVGEIYARFVTHSINRGRYWMEGQTMKLSLRNGMALLAVAKGDFLYINSEDDDFVKYSFVPWP